MNAFLEWFCPWGGMVRVGPEAFKYDDDYTFSVGFRIRRPVRQWLAWLLLRRRIVATLTGTHSPPGGITTAHKNAATASLEEKGYRVKWERRIPVPNSDAKQTRIVMTKTALPAHGSVVDAHKGRAGNNEIDNAVVIARIEGLLNELKAGNIIIESIVGHPTAARGKHRMDGVTVMWRLP